MKAFVGGLIDGVLHPVVKIYGDSDHEVLVTLWPAFGIVTGVRPKPEVQSEDRTPEPPV